MSSASERLRRVCSAPCRCGSGSGGVRRRASYQHPVQAIEIFELDDLLVLRSTFVSLTYDFCLNIVVYIHFLRLYFELYEVPSFPQPARVTAIVCVSLPVLCSFPQNPYLRFDVAAEGHGQHVKTGELRTPVAVVFVSWLIFCVSQFLEPFGLQRCPLLRILYAISTLILMTVTLLVHQTPVAPPQAQMPIF